MRREHELRQIVNMADMVDPVARDDKEGNLKSFIDGMDISPQDKEKLLNLYLEAANQVGDVGITEGIRYSIGDDSEYAEDFIKRLQTGRIGAERSGRLPQRTLRPWTGRIPDVGGLEKDSI